LSSPRVLAVIPARYGSTRFPGKPLVEINGLPLILHVYRRAARIRGIDELIVATDDRRIRAVVEGDGGTAVLTARSHPTGTSRIAEVAAKHRYGVVVNIQGDEPLLPVRCVERLIAVMRSDPSIVMGTLASPESNRHEFMRPDVVKVVCDHDGNAVYFSRSPVPYSAKGFLRHIGVYAYRRSFLLKYGSLRRGPLERFETLEQLRAIENGFKIRVLSCRATPIGIDLPSDVKRVEKRLQSR
jgi:3-deoxy-manno-octulosonate cytidylyltransferase (CMP-KDO synthetase)